MPWGRKAKIIRKDMQKHYTAQVGKDKYKQIGIEKSKAGWDSEMFCYPIVIEYKGQNYMFYNGNNYGRDGFKYAISDTRK
jgi:hypothetical protein